MDAIKAAERGARTLRTIGDALTSALLAGREQLASSVEDAARNMGDALEQAREAGEDALARFNPGQMIEDLYALLGIASASAVADLDERIDYVELKVEEVARKRAREELLLLQQRITELEQVLAHVGDSQHLEPMSGLLSRLSELEARIDALPWTRFEDARRART
jgi:hypothetical protein